MAAPLTQFQKRMAARRGSSNIEALSKQYQQSIKNISGEYEKSFAEYQKKREESMAPYNASVEKYKAEYGVFEKNLADYKNKLSKYQEQLAFSEKNPLVEVSSDQYKIIPNTQPIRTGGMLPVDSSKNEGSKISFNGQTYSVAAGDTNIPEGYTFENGKLYKASAPAKFEEKAPVGPTAPAAPPAMEDFDATQFEEQKVAAESTFKREVNERKAAKLGAVSRRGTRPLLSGAKP